MVPASFPTSLLIVGSGAIGIEFASFYRSLGAEVTVVEMLPRILPAEDDEISELARKAFARQGIAIHTETRVERLTKGEDSVTATLRQADGATTDITAERVILAIGITGNVEGLGLEAHGVQGRQRPYRGRRMVPHRRARPLRHRRRRRSALARAQGEP